MGEATGVEHAPGELLRDRYELRGVIARGPTTLTYAALDLRTGRRVGVRCWPSATVDDATAASELERQVALAQRVTHAYLPRYLDHFELAAPTGRDRYLIHDASEGRTLLEWNHAARGEGELRKVAAALLRALEALHAAQAVHGRVCREEVLLYPDGRLYLMGAAAGAGARGAPSTDLRALGQTLVAMVPVMRLSPEMRDWLRGLLHSGEAGGFASATVALEAMQQEPKGGAKRIAGVAFGLVMMLGVSASVGFLKYGLRAFFDDRPSGVPTRELAKPVADTRFVPTAAPTAPKLELSHRVSMAGHWSAIMQVAFDAEGTRIASASYDGTARLWDAASGTALGSYGHKGKTGSVAFLSADRLISGGDTTVRKWNTTTSELLGTVAADGTQVTRVKVTRDGKHVIAAGFEGVIHVFDADDLAIARTIRQPPRVLALAVDASGESIASAGDDGVIRVFRSADGALANELRGHVKAVNELAFSADGHTLVSASDDRTLKIWYLPAGKLMRTLEGHRDEVWALALSPAGKQLASGSKDGELRIWDSYTGALELSRQADRRGVITLAYSPDGARLAVAGGSQRVDVYALSVQRPSWQPPPITAPITKVAPKPPAGASPEMLLVHQARMLLDESEGGKGLREAEVLLERALAANPKLAAAYVERARIAYKSGYMQRDQYHPEALTHADALLKRALELEPDSFEAHLRLSSLRMFQKDYAAAMQAAQRCEQLRPGDADTQWQFMSIADRQGQDEQVVLHARALIEGNPTQRQLAAAYDMLREVYSRRGEHEAADTMYRSVINLDPDSAWVKGNYAHFLIWHGRYDDAITWARAALAQMDYPAARMTLGEAYASKARVALEQGKLEEHESWLERAFDADPRSAEGHYVKALALRKANDEEGARRELQAALASDPEHERAKKALR